MIEPALADESFLASVRETRGKEDGFRLWWLGQSGFLIKGIASAHETVERDAAGRARFLGYVFRFGPWSVYHSGDAVRYEGMAERLRVEGVGVAMLPINGALPARRVPGNLSGTGAARLAKDIGARVVIPCHYEMFEFNTASPQELETECGRLGQGYRVMQAGERCELG